MRPNKIIFLPNPECGQLIDMGGTLVLLEVKEDIKTNKNITSMIRTSLLFFIFKGLEN
jgi:hypothetical protein